MPDLSITGPITPYGSTGTNGITEKGSGILNLSGANTYKGNVTVLGGSLGGILNANSTQALGNAALPWSWVITPASSAC